MNGQTTQEGMYERLFPDKESKAEAFDALARQYYQGNFGTFPKAEIDLLMFSQYLDRLYSCEDSIPADWSDYRLSKELGITQNRVRSLKERKELKYPSDFDWKRAFLEIVDKAECEGGKIRLFVRDRRLYTELKHLVEEMGAYSETTLTSGLLVVSPPTFIDLMLATSEFQDGYKAAKDSLGAILKKNSVPENYLEESKTLRELIGEMARSSSCDVVVDVLSDIARTIPIVGKSIEERVPDIVDTVEQYVRQRIKETSGEHGRRQAHGQGRAKK